MGNREVNTEKSWIFFFKTRNPDLTVMNQEDMLYLMVQKSIQYNLCTVDLYRGGHYQQNH